MIFKIYKITNIINDLMYVGQTKNSLKKRFNAHCQPRSNSVKLKNAIIKYGRETFKIELIEEHLCRTAADIREAQLISELNTIKNGYNIKSGGAGHSILKGHNKTKRVSSFKGKTHTLEAKALMRLARLGKTPSNKGKKGMLPEEVRKTMSVAKIGNKNRLGGLKYIALKQTGND